MSDLKLADGVATVITYDPPVFITAQGNNFIVVPSDRTLVIVKIWGSGAGGGGRGEAVGPVGGSGGGGGFVETNPIAVSPADDLLVTIGGGGLGGVGSDTAGVSGDGGSGGGGTQVTNISTLFLMCRGGSGGGGGGANGGGVSNGGAGGGGGGTVGQDGFAPVNAVATTGGGGGSLAAGGAGGTGEVTGEAGISNLGGDGADGSGAPIGANTAGGSPFGGAGGAYDTDSPGGGGGAGGFFGGGGGGSGDIANLDSGGGGGGSANNHPGTFKTSLQASGVTSAGALDPDYPGVIGNGGAGGTSGNGGNGTDGLVAVIYGRQETVTTCNDIVIENNAPVLLTDKVDIVAQHVRSILLICQGEWFLDLAAGTPWFTRVIGHKFSAGQINITVRDAILSVAGVAEIQDLTSTSGPGRREATVNVRVLTTEGESILVNAEVPL